MIRIIHPPLQEPRDRDGPLIAFLLDRFIQIRENRQRVVILEQAGKRILFGLGGTGAVFRCLVVVDLDFGFENAAKAATWGRQVIIRSGVIRHVYHSVGNPEGFYKYSF